MKLKILIAAVFFISCTNSKKTAEIYNSWLNHDKSELIQSLGPPNRYDSDGKGGEILIYEKSVTRGNVIGDTYFQSTRHPYKMFYADKTGNIYFWRYGG